MSNNPNEPIAKQYQRSRSPERQLLPLAYIEHMPFKNVDSEELRDVRCHMDYNPVTSYGLEHEQPGIVELVKDEVGHDQRYRYIRKREEVIKWKIT